MTETSAEARMLDPFTLEILRDAFLSITDEMFVTTQRTSQSTIIYEVLDFAVGLTDAEGRLITQGNGVTLFLGTLGEAARRVMEKFADTIREGDIFMMNDPYAGGGTHLSDVSVVMPVFADGTIRCLAINKAHWTEVGGRDPGSVATDTTEIYQEGLQFPCVRVISAGEPNRDVMDMIRANVRVPDMSIGDLYAQIASVRLAGRRFVELGEKYGLETVEHAIARMHHHAAELTSIELGKIPHGTFSAEDWLDEDEHGGPYRICVEVTVGPEEFVCDFTGSHTQLLTPMNCSRTSLNSAVGLIFKAITTPSTPLNEGNFEPLRVICPEGTVFTATSPAPVSTYWEVLVRISDLVWRALAESIPDRVTAGHFLSVCADLIAGDHPDTGELFILFEPNPGGWGAGLGKDGERGVVSIGDGETYNIPVEVVEHKYGVLVRQYAFNIGDGGAGQWRGGEGIIREYELTAEVATATGIMGRHGFPPWGAAGGADGTRNEIVFGYDDGRPDLIVGMVSRVPLKRGDRVKIVTGSGGGWGDPRLRAPALVAEDVRNGFVTERAAEEIYGVTVDPSTGTVIAEIPGRGAA
jgi:N-methylhydantoinase B